MVLPPALGTLRTLHLASPAERVYGQPLTVPGEFFPNSNPQEDLTTLRKQVTNFGPFPPSHQQKAQTHIPPAFSTTTHAFIRVNKHRQPLTKPYTGPFKILRRRSHSYKLDINGKPDWIALSRLKPAYMDQEDDTKYSQVGRPLKTRVIYNTSFEIS